jgi:hypothetical protein
MSKLEVNAVEPQCGTNLTLGASGDTIIIPSGATISNQGTAAGFGPTGAVSWNTTKITADPNPAVSGVGYFCDTTSAAFTITLPATPAAGAVVGIADYANTFATNNITVARNGSNIGGAADNAALFTNGVSVTFVYVDATQGWIVTDSGNRSDLPVPEYVAATGGTVTCCGDYKIHTFTGPGTFTVCSVGNPTGSTTVDYLVVAGGGGGGRYTAGGGGAGGFRYSNSTFPVACAPGAPLASATAIPVSVQGYPITVGAGGASLAGSPALGPLNSSNGNDGTNSVFSTITSAGGGGGGGCGGITGASSQRPGGSGGGAARSQPTGGSGNTPPTSPPQGNNGGNGAACGQAGGGGAIAVGGNATGGAGGGGAGGAGAGLPSAFGTSGQPSGSYYYFSGGAGAGNYDTNPTPGGVGGIGGGGNGGKNQNSPVGGAATNGTTNTGGGGGGEGTTCGQSRDPSGAGGSGIVIIRYKYQ